MTAATTAATTADRAASRPSRYLGEATPSPAGPTGDDHPIRLPPAESISPWLQTLRSGVRPIAFNLRHHRQFGDVWRINILARREGFVVTCHPDHVRSLLTAKPDDAPSLTGETQLRPILGENSILTSGGARHMRQRKLLLPPFHGEAVERYVAMITEVVAREIDRWPLGVAFALAPRMSAITLDVIMSGIFGIEGRPAPGSSGHRLRHTIRRLLGVSTNPLFQVIELQNVGRREATGILKALLGIVDRQLLAIIAERRAEADNLETGERTDILSLLIAARDEAGAPLTDRELRDELLSLVLAGHETTANSLAWTFERLLRTPPAYDALREHVRAGGPDGETYVEATIHEAMRNRPVIPMIVRKVSRPWRFGDYTLPAHTPVAVSIIALHHREDLYPDPLSFRPERFLEHTLPDDPGDERSGEAGSLAFAKPGTYTWIPFGGGIRRCLGASLAMAEQRAVLTAIARRTDLTAADSRPERARQRNVTTIPSRGARALVTARDAG